MDPAGDATVKMRVSMAVSVAHSRPLVVRTLHVKVATSPGQNDVVSRSQTHPYRSLAEPDPPLSTKNDDPFTGLVWLPRPWPTCTAGEMQREDDTLTHVSV